MKYTLLFLLLSIPSLVFSQYAYQAKIVDDESGLPLAFVNVVIHGSQRGTTTDIDGNFFLESKQKVDTLLLTYVGYQNTLIPTINLKKNKTIPLKRTSVKIKEVEILPGENPAHRLINLAIENKKINDPEKASEFFYESYNKLVFTTQFDSTVLANKDSLQKLDTNTREVFEQMQKMHLFMMESTSERNHIPPDLSKEVVIASRVSGLKNPTFSLIGTQLQSFSFYSTYISLFGSNYLSPLSNGSINKYLFILKDTLYEGEDTLFTIQFQPRKGKNFDGLKGQLQISSNQYAIQSIKAEPATSSEIDIRIQQKYEFVDGKQWFPVQLNTDLTFNNIEVDEYKIVGIGRSYLKNIELKSRLSKREIGNTVLQLDPKAGMQDSLYWKGIRQDSLDAKEKETYRLIDSIGDEMNLDAKMKFVETLASGNFPVGPLDFPLHRLFDYNDYEGFRLGMGVETNDKFIKNFRVGGYGAYGFKDKAWKYGGYGLWMPNSNREFKIKAAYSKDVIESGGTQFFENRLPTFTNEGLKKLYINRMDEMESYDFNLSFRSMRDFKFAFIANIQNRKITSDYQYVQDESMPLESTDRFRLFQPAIDVRYSYKEKYVEMFGQRFPVESKYPIVRFRFTKGLDMLMEGDYEFERFDLKIDQSILWKNIGVSSFRFQAGMIQGSLPLTAQYRTEGTYSSGLLIATEYSFETVRPNEFYSDRYFNAFFRHNFKSLLFKSKNFQPQLALLASYGIGELTQTIDQHRNVDFNTLEKGLIETGMAINKIFTLNNTAFGVAAFYRLGRYAEADWEDNFIAKLSAVIAL